MSRITITIPEKVLREVDARGDNRSAVISRDLERYYTLLQRVIKRVRLSVEEACLIVDALNGILIDANTVQLLWANVADAISLDRLDQKWGIDGQFLIEKLRGLNELQAMALVDAAERFWEKPEGDIRERVAQIFGVA